MKLRVCFNFDELNRLQFPIVVENYEKIKHGSAKRKYLAEFPDVKVRTKIRELYNLFYRWYLVTGTPNEHAMSLEDYDFARRVVNFFAGV